jgi:hypothetical protein
VRASPNECGESRTCVVMAHPNRTRCENTSHSFRLTRVRCYWLPVAVTDSHRQHLMWTYRPAWEVRVLPLGRVILEPMRS